MSVLKCTKRCFKEALGAYSAENKPPGRWLTAGADGLIKATSRTLTASAFVQHFHGDTGGNMPTTETEVYELNLTPSGADTIITTREEFEALVKEAFEEEGRSDLLTGGAVTIRPQRPFPGVEVVLPILIWFGEQVALDIFKRKVLPKLEARFQAWWTKKPSSTPQPPESDPSENPTPPESK